jgi:hypothetical protein
MNHATHSTLISLLLAVLAAAFGALTAPAEAATYQVKSCAAAAGYVNHAWSFEEKGAPGQFESEAGCGVGGEYGGLWVQERLHPPDSHTGDAGYWVFASPPGSTVSAISYSRHLHTYADPDFLAELKTNSGQVLEQCRFSFPMPGNACDLGSAGSASLVTASGLNASSLEFGGRCGAPPDGTPCVHGGTIHSVIAALYFATVTVNDPSGPSVGTLGGTLFDGGWVRGTKSATFSASDASGISGLTLVRDDSVTEASDPQTCDFTYAAPCPTGTVNADWSPVSLANWPDGIHKVVARASDAAGNVSETPAVTVKSDNHAPAAPGSLVSDTGPAWNASAARTLTWSLPSDDFAPVAAATVRLCGPGGACTEHAASSLTGDQVSLPSPGAWTASVFLTDAAGNVDSTQSSAAVLAYDPGVPAAPELGTPQVGSSANERIVSAGFTDPGPSSAHLRAELCRPDGGDCSAVTPVSDSEIRVTLPGSGDWLLRARVRDEAGNVSSPAAVRMTATPEPTLTPTPTPMPTPAPLRSSAKLTAKVRIAHGRLQVRGTITKLATRRVTVRIAAGKRSMVRKLTPRAGRFARTVRLPKWAGRKRLRVRVSYPGDPKVRSAAVTRRVRSH